MLLDPIEYRERRQASATAEIVAANGDRDTLKTMLAKRKSLARVYAEDGAVQTARCIETVDIALIEAALAR